MSKSWYRSRKVGRRADARRWVRRWVEELASQEESCWAERLEVSSCRAWVRSLRLECSRLRYWVLERRHSVRRREVPWMKKLPKIYVMTSYTFTKRRSDKGGAS